MEISPKEAEQNAQAVETRLNAKITDPGAPLEQTAQLLDEYRVACEKVAFADFLYARAQDVEAHLWMAHSRVNTSFRKQLSQLRKGTPAKAVETRKFVKLYLEFLKNSQRFYREYIQRLNARFGGLPELERIAQLVKADGKTIYIGLDRQPQNLTLKAARAPEVGLTATLREQLLLSVHQTLIYLGDLSRYRATERLDREPDWGPAIGYYGLAGSLRPSSGMSYHQQSVIAAEEGDHLRTIYNLYRAIVVDEPHPNAGSNLGVAMKKVDKAWDKGKLMFHSAPGDRDGSRKVLVAWFVRFHSMCYKGQSFAGYEEMEQEVLNHLAAELKGRGHESTLSKLFFVNFAAQYAAAAQFERNPEASRYMQSFFSCFRLNVKTYALLLDVYQEDLLAHGDGSATSESEQLANEVTPLARHLLPGLRLHSSWLLTNTHLLTAGIGDDALQASIRKLWSSYAATLSVIASIFPVRNLPEVQYQLEEDVDSAGFKPLISKHTQKTWILPDSDSTRPAFSDKDVSRCLPNIEMLTRIRGLLIDGLLLAVDKNAPITFTGSGFAYGDETTTSKHVFVPVSSTQNESTANAPATVHEKPNGATAVSQAQQNNPPSLPNARSMDERLNQMVDDLVGADDGDDNLPRTPPTSSFADAAVYNYDDELSRSTDSLNGSGRIGNGADRKGRPMPLQTVARRSSASIWGVSAPRSSTPLPPSSTDPWFDGLPPQSSPSLPHPHSARMSPNAAVRRSSGHSRVNSATSIRSGSLQPEALSSIVPTPQPLLGENGTLGTRASYSHTGNAHTYGGIPGHQSGMHSPLLFGAGGGPWSTLPRMSSSSYTPPNGQGG